MPERVYCADLCLASGEPLLGTATQVDVWLMLEYKPVWKRKAVEDNDLAAPVREWLQGAVAAFAAQGRKARPQSIRRPELDTALTTLFVAEGGALRRFEGMGYGEFARLDLAGADASAGKEVSAPQYFVCTNGQRDLCCARYGLPVYARLREAVGGRVWQTTHVGGHRFAPNVLALPQGALYGRVFADEVDDFLGAVEAGALSLPHLRGRAAYPPQAQAAEARLDGGGMLKVIDGDSVTFDTAGGPRTLKVVRASTPYDVIASCGNTETEVVFPFV